MRLRWIFAFGALFALTALTAVGQGNKEKTVAKPMTDKQRRQQEEKLRKELQSPFKKWLDQDVGVGAGDPERGEEPGSQKASREHGQGQYNTDDAVLNERGPNCTLRSIPC